MTPSLTQTLLAAALAWSATAAMAAPPPETGRRGPRAAEGADADGRVDRRERDRGAVGGRRAIEDPPRASVDVASTPLEIVDRREHGCRVLRAESLRQKLLALTQRDPLVTLELWGDAHAYVPLQKVVFYARSPFAVYVTLYWIGPAGDIIVPVENVRIPANRDVAIDTGGYIVPPLGREQWVAIATLEPIDVGCGYEVRMYRALEAALTLPHGVGRWDVWSRVEGAPDPDAIPPDNE